MKKEITNETAENLEAKSFQNFIMVTELITSRNAAVGINS